MLAEKLLENGIRLRDYGYGENQTTCPNCSPTRKKKNDKCLSVKVDDEGGAAWFCHHCNWSGNVTAFEQKWTPPKVPEKPKKDQSMYDWFKGRGISKETVDAAGCYLDHQYFGNEKKACIAYPYFENGRIVNVKYRTKDKMFKQSKDGKKTLYGIDDCDGLDVIWPEGENDRLALWECGYRNIVSLPDGAPKEAKFNDKDKRFEALRNCSEKLKDVERVFVATDSDAPGQALAEEIAYRFGKDRCWRVTWPEGCKDANDTLLAHGKDKVIECIEKAEPWPIDGVYRFKDFEEEILNLYHGIGPKPIELGYGEFDEYYKVMPGTFHVVTGVPNHGKSNFLEQITTTLAVKENWKFAIFSPEHSAKQYASRLIEKIAKKPFTAGPTERMSEGELKKHLEFINEHFFYIATNDHTPTIDWILERAKYSCLRNGINGLIIDPYNEIEAGRGKSQTETEFVSQLISKVKRFGRTHNVTCWIVAHPAKMPKNQDGEINVPDLYSISGSAHWYNKADMGLVVHRNFEERSTKVYVEKVKEQPFYGNKGASTFWFDVAQRIYKPAGAF